MSGNIDGGGNLKNCGCGVGRDNRYRRGHSRSGGGGPTACVVKQLGLRHTLFRLDDSETGAQAQPPEG